MSAAVARRVLASDLPTADHSKLTNPLYRSRGLRVNDWVWYWQSTVPCSSSEWIVFAADHTRMQISLDGDAVFDLESDLQDWKSYEDETRLLAWTARHEPLIQLLRGLFQRDLTPESCEHSVMPAPRVQAGFAIFHRDGRYIVSGRIEFDARFCEPLAARTDFCNRRPHQAVHRAYAQLTVVLDDFGVSPSEFSALTRGCIVRLDNRTLLTEPCRVTIPAGRASLVADITGLRAQVVSAQGGNQMSSLSVSPLSPTDGAVPVESLPVHLTFTAGHLTLPFGALCDIAPGYVFDLAKRLDDQVITIYANETPIAFGELVVIGDLVGVRITRMLPHA